MKRRDGNDMIRWVVERVKTGRGPRGRREKEINGLCEGERKSGGPADAVEESARWKTTTRRPDPPEGTNRMMMVMMFFLKFFS